MARPLPRVPDRFPRLAPAARRLLVVVAVMAGFPAAAPASIRTTQRVEMSDGVGLSTSVILPFENGGHWPTILVRSPYVLDQGGPAGFEEGLEMAAGFGYAVVLQDTRGAGASEGAAVPFMMDPPDGQETPGRPHWESRRSSQLSHPSPQGRHPSVQQVP